ncbi:MAG TPA: LTA synthase family protein [Gemmatimonadaceae bacterium]|nr:LTA synthase family protein [Gemmatimonadaceae bacterium]
MQESDREARAQQRPLSIWLQITPIFLAFVFSWAKLSYFNLPPKTQLENDWYDWGKEEAIRAVIGNAATLAILYAPLCLLSARKRYIGALILDTLITLIVLADMIHFRFYGDIISLAAAGSAWQIALIWRSIVALLSPGDVLLFVDILLGVVLLRPYGRVARSRRTERLRWRAASATALGIAGCFAVLVPIRIVRADTDSVFQYRYFRFFGARKIGLLNYHFFEAGEDLKRTFETATPEERRRERAALAYVARWHDTAMTRSPLYGVARGKNLIIVMVESLHKFPLGLEIDGTAVMPNMTSFASRSLYFDRFFSQSADGTTSDGEFTSLQSLYPLPAGSVQAQFPTNNYRGVPRILADHGYATMSAHAFFGDLFNMRTVHPRLGFQRSFFKEDYKLNDVIGLGLSDVEFFRQTLPRLKGEPRPFMAYMITLSTHHPWKPAENYEGMDVGKLKGSFLGQYIQSMHRFDAGFGEFIDSLQKTGLLDQSVVVVYGDHKADLGRTDERAREALGRLFGSRPGWTPPDSGFDYRYWQLMNQLPLIIHLPGDRDARQISTTAGHLDIAPTVLNLLGIGDSNMTTFGRDVSGGVEDFVVLRNGSFAYGDTVCVTPNASAALAKCNNSRTGERLEPAKYEARFAEARARLSASDLIIQRNLIPTK